MKRMKGFPQKQKQKVLNFDYDIHIMLLEQQISISELFQKDHVTLKTEVIAAKYSPLTSQAYITFKIY